MNTKVKIINNNINKLNATMPWSSGIFPGVQRWLNTHKSINMVHHSDKIKHKNHDYLSRGRKNIWQNSTSTYDKNSQQGGYRGDVPQCNKDHIRQTHSKHHSQW